MRHLSAPLIVLLALFGLFALPRPGEARASGEAAQQEEQLSASSLRGGGGEDDDKDDDEDDDDEEYRVAGC